MMLLDTYKGDSDKSTTHNPKADSDEWEACWRLCVFWDQKKASVEYHLDQLSYAEEMDTESNGFLRP